VLIVNFKIRMFIEKLKDKLKRFEQEGDYVSVMNSKALQLDRVENTIA
jgi:hypothetical protein